MKGVRAEQHNDAQRKYYGDTVRGTITPTDSPYVRRHVDEVLRAAGVVPGARVLDAGCGMGRHAFLLAERGFAVEGLDLSAALLEQMRQRDGARIPTYCADLAAPPEEIHGRYEAVLGFFILHHLLDLKAAFAGLGKVVRPGGSLVFIEPNPANFLYYAQIACTPGMKWQAERGILSMRTGVMYAAMRGAGLVEPSVYRFGFLPPFLRNRRWGGAVDRAAERLRILEPLLPFQVFRAVKRHDS